jgi:hypothetical protein
VKNWIFERVPTVDEAPHLCPKQSAVAWRSPHAGSKRIRVVSETIRSYGDRAGKGVA